MAESANKKGVEKQMAGPQHKVQDPQSELQAVADAPEKIVLKETVEVEQKVSLINKVNQKKQVITYLRSSVHLSVHGTI